MNPAAEWRDYLADVVDAMRKAMHFTEGMDYAAFAVDDKTTFAVIRALEIVGEATKKIPESVRVLHSDIPWRAMSGMRDKLIHDYTGVNLEVVWRTVQQDLPALCARLEPLLDDRATGSTNAP